MNSRFNYRDALNGIKAGLFDIYEDQEQEIGLEEDEEKRNIRLNKFIEVKNVALMLIEGIEYLYEEATLEKDAYILGEKLENPDISEEIEESKILNLVENTLKNSIKEVEEVNDNNEVNVEVEDKRIDNDNFDATTEIEVHEENQDFSLKNVENVEDSIDEETSDLKKYYLTCDIEDVNFAYVPEGLYKKIKENAVLSVDASEDFEEDFSEIESEAENDANIYKIDQEKVRGIIVRSDQYMKLALSRHRQEGVLEEAKQFRIEEAKKRQREEQKRELEKAEVKIDI